MKTDLIKAVLKMLILVTITTSSLLAHPGGNMVVSNGIVTFQYVYPPSSQSHKSSVFIWDRIQGVRRLITSEFNSSDFSFCTKGDSVYYVESRDETRGQGYFRVLKGRAGEVPTEIWPWQSDSLEAGYYGFDMPNDSTMIFAKYPAVYTISKSGVTQKMDIGYQEVNFLKKVDAGFLIKSGSKVILLNEEWTIVKQWSDLIDEKVTDTPFMGNIIFHVDYDEGELLVAYWGGREFYTLSDDGERKSLVTLDGNQAAHWVAMEGGTYYLFGSVINPPEPITPIFYVYEDQPFLIWEK